MCARTVRLMLCALVAAVAMAPTSRAGQVTKDKVPAAVLQAFAASFPGARVMAYSVEKQNGKLCYEIESVDGGNTRDALYAADGTMIEMEEGLSPADLPATVIAAVTAKYPKGKVAKAERLTRGDHVGFELAVKTGGRTVEMSFDAPAEPAAVGYRLSGSLPIGGEGGWDYLKVDAAARRLYVSHATRVHVIDLEKGAIVGVIADTPGVHGIAVAPGLGRGFVSNGHANTVTVFDLKTLATVATIAVSGENPDAIAFDPASGRVFTFNGRSANATAIDAAGGEVVGTITLGGKPEFAVPDGRGTVFVNIEDTSELVAFDARTLEVKTRWPLAPCEEPSGLALDAEHRRLFSVCGNAMMAVVDADTGKVITTLPTGDGTDGAAFDPATGLAFASNGAGTLTVVHEDSPEMFTVLGNVTTKRGARTIALDESTHRLYLPTAQYGPPPSPTAERPHPRPSAIPGTFEVLVLERP
jgi:DNA-binding beta-propeller fold protein YncE